MNENNLLTLILAFIVLAFSLAAFFTCLGLFFPGRIARTQQIMLASPGRAVLVGLVNFLFLAGVSLILFQLTSQYENGLVTLLAILAAAALIISISFGLTGTVTLVSEKILPGRSSLLRMFTTSILLSLGCAFPLAGWFGLLPFLICYGMGGFILTLFNRQALLPSD